MKGRDNACLRRYIYFPCVYAIQEFLKQHFMIKVLWRRRRCTVGLQAFARIVLAKNLLQDRRDLAVEAEEARYGREEAVAGAAEHAAAQTAEELVEAAVRGGCGRKGGADINKAYPRPRRFLPSRTTGPRNIHVVAAASRREPSAWITTDAAARRIPLYFALPRRYEAYMDAKQALATLLLAEPVVDAVATPWDEDAAIEIPVFDKATLPPLREQPKKSMFFWKNVEVKGKPSFIQVQPQGGPPEPAETAAKKPWYAKKTPEEKDRAAASNAAERARKFLWKRMSPDEKLEHQELMRKLGRVGETSFEFAAEQKRQRKMEEKEIDKRERAREKRLTREAKVRRQREISRRKTAARRPSGDRRS